MLKGNSINSTRLWAKQVLFLWFSGRQEFVDAYVNYIFQISVHEWYTAFSSGFLKVCGGKVLELFQPSELRAMMVGNSNYDWEELEEVSIFFPPRKPQWPGEVCPEPRLPSVGFGGLSCILEVISYS